MLEEALNNPNGSPPETARALLSFFGQEFPLGGTAAESRFVHFFSTLVERVFGPVIADSLSREHEFTAEQLKLINAAWLMYSRQWSYRTSTPGSSPPPSVSYSPYGTHASSVPKLDSDPVVQLLSTPQHFQTSGVGKGAGKFSNLSLDSNRQSTGNSISFFRILSCQADLDLHILRNARSAFPFAELPRNMQDDLVRLVNMDSTGNKLSESTISSHDLLGCLSINPLRQKDFVLSMRQILAKQSFGHDAGTITNSSRSVSSIQSPILSSGRITNQHVSPAPSSVQNIDVMIQNLHLDLSLWDYYFMVFCHFPLLMGKMNQVKKSGGSSSSSSYGTKPRISGSAYGEKVYIHLLKDYIKYFFPHEFENANSSASTESGHLPVKADMNGSSELIIRLMIEYWLEKHEYADTKYAMANLSVENVGIESSYDLAQLLPGQDVWSLSDGLMNRRHQRYDAPPKQVQRCIKILVDHLVCDPAIARQSLDYSKREGIRNIEDTAWPIPKMHTILQPSLYNYIRTGLRYGPIHVARSSFFAAMDLWLMWLEPWNVQRKKTAGATMQAKQYLEKVTHISSPTKNSNSSRRKVQEFAVYTTPKPNQNSKFTVTWKPYVAANLHLYIVPLAIFLRRARELEFTKGDFQRSIDYVQRVVRVFSPKLVEALDDFLNRQTEGCGFQLIVERHEAVLGTFSPVRSMNGEKKWNLKMLQEEMHNLLEEITIQHQKAMLEQDIIEKFFARIESFFRTNAEEVVISKLVQKAKLIVKFSDDYEVVPSTKRRTGLFGTSHHNDASDTGNDISPERESSGFVTEKGRDQILHGYRMCNAIDVNFLGDPMYARPKSHEIKFLVKWTLQLSNKLNIYFKLDAPQNKLYDEKSRMTAEQLAKEGEEISKVGLFRFNLRFLADTRNWSLILVLLMLARWQIMG